MMQMQSLSLLAETWSQELYFAGEMTA